MKIKEKNDSNTKGLFSDKKYQVNENIHKLKGIIYQIPSRTTIEIDTDKHIDDEYGIYMNHSFSPNCVIKDGSIIAVCDINENEELTFNYNENETKIACPFLDHTTNQKVSGKIY
jgi:hypothetical protein